MTRQFIVLDTRAMGRIEAEERVLSALRACGIKDSKSHIQKNGLTWTDADGKHIQRAFEELVADTMLTGEVTEIDRRLWRDKDPHGTVALATDMAAGPGMVIGMGAATSRALQGPGYLTNAVVADTLEDILYYRTEVARLSVLDDQFRPCFRAFRAYHAACITAIDALLNRCVWVANTSQRTFSPEEAKLLARRSLPLDEKFRAWVPILASGKSIDETSQAWSEYQALRRTRNAYIHVNEPDYLFSLKEAAGALNLARFGVGQLLIDLCGFLGVGPNPMLYRVRHAPTATFTA